MRVFMKYLRCGDLHEACPELVEGAGIFKPGGMADTCRWYRAQGWLR